MQFAHDSGHLLFSLYTFPSGYVVAPFFNDGFAMLRGDRIFRNRNIASAFNEPTTGVARVGKVAQARIPDIGSSGVSGEDLVTADAEAMLSDRNVRESILGPEEDREPILIS